MVADASGSQRASLAGSTVGAGLDAFDAASAGSWLHGAAATLASDGGPLTAGKVADRLADVVAGLPFGTIGP